MYLDNIDNNHERVSLNCKYWQAITQLDDGVRGVICRMGNGKTNPDYTCSQFMPDSSFDSLQDPNKYHDKYHKLK